jgi:rubrerythrin
MVAGTHREVTMDPQTRANILTALHGEAYAHARYQLFAEAARLSGDDRLADMFEGIAAVELREHFHELAGLLGLVGADADNLAVAIQDESAEVEELYRSFAEQARKAGDDAAAARFEEIRGDEREHLKALETALERLELPV